MPPKRKPLTDAAARRLALTIARDLDHLCSYLLGHYTRMPPCPQVTVARSAMILLRFARRAPVLDTPEGM